MQEAQDLAMLNYRENMEFFKEKHPELSNKLIALETILDDGSYKQKYDLEYKDGYFDIVELNSGSFLYNQNSEKFSEELLNHVTFKKDDQVFESNRYYKYEKDALEYLKPILKRCS